MNGFYTCFRTMAGLVVATLFAVNAVAVEPRQVVEETYNQVRTVLMSENGSNTPAVRGEVEKLIYPRFDFPRMTALAVGKNWKQATPEQKEALAREFQTLLSRTYFITMLRYRDSGVNIKPDVLMENEGKEATVRTDVSIPNSQTPVGIDYVLYKQQDGWKVYNVVVEGASLVTVYRNQFGEEVSKGGVDGLIQSLHNKNSAAGQ